MVMSMAYRREICTSPSLFMLFMGEEQFGEFGEQPLLALLVSSVTVISDIKSKFPFMVNFCTGRTRRACISPGYGLAKLPYRLFPVVFGLRAEGLYDVVSRALFGR